MQHPCEGWVQCFQSIHQAQGLTHSTDAQQEPGEWDCTLEILETNCVTLPSANPTKKKEYIIYMKGFWVYTYLDHKRPF